jgi:hypothetical protein
VLDSDQGTQLELKQIGKEKEDREEKEEEEKKNNHQ